MASSELKFLVDVGVGKKQVINETQFEESSGNVFLDLGLPNPKEELLKAQLGIEILNTINERKLTQKLAAEILGVKQEEISHLKNGRFSYYSLESLFRFLNLLNCDVNIHMSGIKQEEGHLQLTFP